jgi:hypothetical protein
MSRKETHPKDANRKDDASRYAAFVLRCSIDEQGKVRGRVLDAGSGVSHPFSELGDLPALIRRLVEESYS